MSLGAINAIDFENQADYLILKKNRWRIEFFVIIGRLWATYRQGIRDSENIPLFRQVILNFLWLKHLTMINC